MAGGKETPRQKMKTRLKISEEKVKDAQGGN